MKTTVQGKGQRIFKFVSLILMIIGFSGCKNSQVNPEQKVWKQTRLELHAPDLRSKQQSNLTGVSLKTCLVQVVSGKIVKASNLADPAKVLAEGLLDLSTNQVTLTLPLDTPLRLIRKGWTKGYALDQSKGRAEGIGISKIFTVSGTDTQLNLSVPLLDAPALTEISPKEGATNQLASTTISLSFNNPLDSASLSVNTNDTQCSGSIQLSSDNFLTCVTFSGPAQMSNDNKKATIAPAKPLTGSTTYKIKVNTTIKDLADNGLVTPFVATTGFSTGSSAKSLKTFTFNAVNNPALSTDLTGTISGTTVTATVPFGTDVTSLIPTFTHSAQAVTVASITQNSATTPNDFTSNVVYTLTAADGTSQDYTVTVTLAKSNTKSISLFSLKAADNTALSVDVAGNISGTSITATLPFGTDVTNLVAAFTQDGSTVTVGATQQTSGTTANDFSSPVTYKVTAADGTTQNYTVTLTLAPSNTNTITAFSFAAASNSALFIDVAATISGTNISATVPYGTQVTALIPTFSHNGSTVTVGVASQTSSVTANDFTNPVIYKVTAADGTVNNYTVTLTTAAFNIAGVVTTIAGSGVQGAVNGIGTAASFKLPSGITSDGANLYVADYGNNLIRKIVISTGVVTTFAGSGTASTTDGTGTAATFNGPIGLDTDGTSLYVVEQLGHFVRKIVISTGVVTTLAGGGGFADGVGLAAKFNQPYAICVDGGNLYIADSANNRVRKIVISTATVSTLAGSGAVGAVDGTGAGATFSAPVGITSDGTNLYVGDRNNHKIRKIVIATAAVTTLAGSGVAGSANATGAAATFNQPFQVAVGGTDLFVNDWGNHMVRKIGLSTGVVSTVAGSLTAGGTDGTGTAASFTNPWGIYQSGGKLFVVNYGLATIRVIQ